MGGEGDLRVEDAGLEDGDQSPHPRNTDNKEFSAGASKKSASCW